MHTTTSLRPVRKPRINPAQCPYQSLETAVSRRGQSTWTPDESATTEVAIRWALGNAKLRSLARRAVEYLRHDYESPRRRLLDRVDVAVSVGLACRSAWRWAGRERVSWGTVGRRLLGAVGGQ